MDAPPPQSPPDPGQPPRLARAPERVVGYHGCQGETARRILEGEPFLPSQNAYDWLGAGVYFWEYAPARAREWAERRFGSDAAVLEADIAPGRCLNLLDTEHFAGLARAYARTVELLQAQNLPLPANRHKRHFLDRAVVEFYCRDVAAVSGFAFHSVRVCFPEGEPLYRGSRLLRETHVQVTVRELACLSAVRRVY